MTPRNLAEHVEGRCSVILFVGRRELLVSVRLKRSMFDRVDDPRDWEPLRRGLRIGFDGASEEAFRITSASVKESTLTLRCDYPGKGTLDRIRRIGTLRLGRSDDAVSGVLLEVVEAKTIAAAAKRPADPAS